MSETSPNEEQQIGSLAPTWTDEFNLSSTGRVELGCNVQSVSIGNMNGQALETFQVVHPDHEKEMQLSVAETTLENDEPSTSTMHITFTQTSTKKFSTSYLHNNLKMFAHVVTELYLTEKGMSFSRKGITILIMQLSIGLYSINIDTASQEGWNISATPVTRILGMPRNAAAQLGKRACENLLKALQNKPEFVCICCNQMLFRKTVVVFHENKYDFKNAVVERALSTPYRYKSECHNDEFICVTCHNNLKRWCPKMQAQGVANGLSLPDVSNELSNLTEIERRLISLHIPFMKILALHRAGSHYKINGPCVNVLTTLSRVCKLLPRLPDEAQLIPMKLKQKIEYKGYHMYGSIRKEVVMNAVKWLKENNEHYKDIELNNLWDDEWMQSEFDALLQPTGTEETQTGVQNDVDDLVTGSESQMQADQEII